VGVGVGAGGGGRGGGGGGAGGGNSALLAATGARWRHAARRGPSGVGRNSMPPKGATGSGGTETSSTRTTRRCSTICSACIWRTLPACPCGGAGVSKEFRSYASNAKLAFPRADRLHHTGLERRHHRFFTSGRRAGYWRDAPLSAMHSQREYFSRIYSGSTWISSICGSTRSRLVKLAMAPSRGARAVHRAGAAKLIFRLDLPEPPLLTLMHSQDGTSFGTARTYEQHPTEESDRAGGAVQDLGFGPACRSASS